MIVYIDGIFEHRYNSQNEQTISHISENAAKVATVYDGYDFDSLGESKIYYIQNHLGSNTLQLSTTGTLIAKEEYYPFGDSVLRTVDKTRYRYVGKEKDAESGLYYYGARYYAAWTCRFISVDPMASSRSWLNSYNYVQNNPIMNTDPDGGLDNGGGDPVKKGDTFVGDDGKTYTASFDSIEVTATATPKAEKFNNISLDGLSTNSYPNYMNQDNNVVTYNSIQRWFGGTAKNLGYDPNELLKMSETEKQDFMQQGETETLLMLMGEFATGTGPEKRNFDASNPMTQGLMRSLTAARGYAQMRQDIADGKLADNQTEIYSVPYSPDNAGLFNSLSYHKTSLAMGNLSEFARGSVTMNITRYGDSAVVQLTDSYTISSASVISRAMGMVTGQPAASNQNRVQGQYSPLGTTNQTYTWTIDLKSIILDYDSINR